VSYIQPNSVEIHSISRAIVSNEQLQLNNYIYSGQLVTCHRAGVGKVRPAGYIRPVNSVDPARGGSSVSTLNPARVLLPNAPKDVIVFMLSGI